MKFYDREKEIEILKKIKGRFRIVVTGRRRIGKTTLVEHFYKNRCITFFIPAEKAEKEIISDWVNEYQLMHLPRLNTFKEFFEFVFFHFKDKVIFIDEIQNVLKVNRSFIFDLQRLIDKYKPKLVISGSLISTMKKIIEEQKSPLYGRFDFVIKLKEFDFQTVYKICKDHSLGIEDAFKLYSIFGGIPKYYELIEKLKGLKFEKFISDMFIVYPRPLYEEVRIMLKEEFGKEYKTFFSILSAISSGSNKHSEIAGFIGKKQTEITKYLAMLKDDFELIERKIPVCGGKKGVYEIKNNIFSFWFSNVWRYNQLIETGEEKKIVEIVKRNLNKYVSHLFEKSILEIMSTKVFPSPFDFTKIGKQWGKIPNAPKDKNQYEIDIVLLNEKSKEALFAECKWQDRVDAEKVLTELKEKSHHVEWHTSKRKEYYAIFAKSFKKRIKEPNLFLFDLRDLQKILR